MLFNSRKRPRCVCECARTHDDAIQLRALRRCCCGCCCCDDCGCLTTACVWCDGLRTSAANTAVHDPSFRAFVLWLVCSSAFYTADPCVRLNVACVWSFHRTAIWLSLIRHDRRARDRGCTQSVKLGRNFCRCNMEETERFISMFQQWTPENVRKTQHNNAADDDGNDADGVE